MGKGNFRFTVDEVAARNDRHRKRLKNKLHQKKVGDYFIRVATGDQVYSNTGDTRIYDGPDGPLTEESGRLMFDVLCKSTYPGLVQLFTKTGDVVDERLDTVFGNSLMSMSDFDDGNLDDWVFKIAVDSNIYKKIMASLRRNGFAYSFSKHNVRRDVRFYNGKPYEHLEGLPLREICKMKALMKEGGTFNKDGPLAPFIQKHLDNGLSKRKAMTEAMKDFHVSQGRSREGNKASNRPLANCKYCHSRENQKKKFKCCGACRMVCYCCKECQDADWTDHKSFCKKNRVNK